MYSRGDSSDLPWGEHDGYLSSRWPCFTHLADDLALLGPPLVHEGFQVYTGGRPDYIQFISWSGFENKEGRECSLG